jgi:hypothetical protein
MARPSAPDLRRGMLRRGQAPPVPGPACKPPVGGPWRMGAVPRGRLGDAQRQPNRVRSPGLELRRGRFRRGQVFVRFSG